MANSRSPNRDKAFKIFKDNKGKLKPKEIADMLNEKVSRVYAWKNKDNWNRKLKGNVGAPSGNKNAIGNNGGAPKGNLNSLKHGMYCDESKRLPNEFIKKWFPVGLKSAYEQTANLEISKVDKLGYAIDILWAKILVSQKITSVKNKKDLTKELKKESWGKNNSKEYEIQFAWDKENNSLDINSKAMDRLSKMINTYEELLHKNWDFATKEQKERIKLIKAQRSKITGEDNKKGNSNSTKKLDSILNELNESGYNE
ncbi:phage terminase small subunit [Clostridium sp. BJN0001]|uniref:phage terminase small subunit n=1 Tax=Clostridium sp. BJN0001 TaxID=2930219 RepID=UPI001FD13F8C|nr:phage terminase small subunit [Clostridium sp. BJN0001]